MTVKNRERGSVNTEEVPEETYPDLLPFEMERVEAIMGTMFAHSKKQGEQEKKLLGDINTKLTSAKKEKENNWGHRWRESPVLGTADQAKTIAERAQAITGNNTARAAITKKYWDSVFENEDPILASALADKRSILGREDEEYDGDPELPETD